MEIDGVELGFILHGYGEKRLSLSNQIRRSKGDEKAMLKVNLAVIEARYNELDLLFDDLVRGDPA